MKTKIYNYLNRNEYATYSVNDLATKLHLHPIDVANALHEMLNNNEVDKIIDTDYDTGIKTTKYKAWVRYVGKVDGEFRVTSFAQPNTIRITSKTIDKCYSLITDRYDLKDLGSKLFY